MLRTQTAVAGTTVPAFVERTTSRGRAGVGAAVAGTTVPAFVERWSRRRAAPPGPPRHVAGTTVPAFVECRSHHRGACAGGRCCREGHSEPRLPPCRPREPVFDGLLCAVLPTVSPGMRESVDTMAASSITCIASSGCEPKSGSALASDGCIAGMSTVFRNVRLPVSSEGRT